MDNTSSQQQRFCRVAGALVIACGAVLLSVPVIKSAAAADGYDNLIRTYEACLELEQEVFSQLTFSLSDNQSGQGHTLKLVLKDQLGRPWLFKFLSVVEKQDQDYGSKNVTDLLSVVSRYATTEYTPPELEERYLAWAFYQDLSQLKYASLEEKEAFLRWEFKNAVDGNATAVDAYRIFLLFGINSPEIHFIALRINDTWAVGTIQRFIPSKGSLEDVPPATLPESQAEFLLKAHVFHWLAANLDTSGDHFLLTKGSGDGDQRIAVIDNSIFPQFFGQVVFDAFGCIDNQTYYRGLFTAYVRNRMRLPLEENYEFVRFVSEFPEDYFKALLSPLIQNREEILERKKSMTDYFSKLYAGMARARGTEIRFSDRPACDKISLILRKRLKQRIAQLQKTEKELKHAGLRTQRPLHAYLSYDAYVLVWKFNQLKRRLDQYDPGMEEYRDRILDQLYQLRWATRDPLRSGMIAYFIDRFENQIAKKTIRTTLTRSL
jgi:hypothetical protein